MQQGLTDAAGKAWPLYAETITLIHGAADGFDLMCAGEAEQRGWQLEPHAADWFPNGKFDMYAGHRRNQVMVDAGADECVAGILPCTQRNCTRPMPHPTHGTMDCVGRAMLAGIHVIPVYPERLNNMQLLTPEANAVLHQASEESDNLGHSYIGATHLVLALSKKGQGKVREALNSVGADYGKLRSGVISRTGKGWKAYSDSGSSYTARVRSILDHASKAAGGNDVTSEHLLTGLMNHGTSIGLQVLRDCGSLSTVRDALNPPAVVRKSPSLEEKVDALVKHFGIRL